MEWLQHIELSAVILKNLQGLFVSLGIGLLLGLEREFSKKGEEQDRVFAGVRTFPIVALTGFVCGLLAELYSDLILVTGFIGVFALIALSYQNSRTSDPGTTTEFSLLMTFLLGTLVYSGRYHLSVSVAVLVTMLLSMKIRLHQIVNLLSRSEVTSILIFVIITALVLPLLPNHDFGKYGIFNPYKIWLIVVIFVSLNFLFYFLEKFLDKKKSILTTGILGGFASSTAAAWFFARQSSNKEGEASLQAAAIVLASSIMFFRLLIWLLLLNQAIFKILLLPVGFFGTTGLLLGYFLTRQPNGKLEIDQSIIQKRNPINLKEALFFTLIFIVVELLVGYADNQFGQTGTFLAAGISGITDIDAITVSMADFGKSNAKEAIAAVAILIAAFSNTLVKFSLCLLFGSSPLKKNASKAFIPLFIMGVAYILYLLA